MTPATGTGDTSLLTLGALRPACRCGLPGVMAAAAGMGEQILWAEFLEPACQAWAPGGQYSSIVGMREPSIQIVGAVVLLVSPSYQEPW
jgi:hypothetical protein